MEMTPEDKAEFAIGIAKTFMERTQEYLIDVEQLFKNNRDVMQTVGVGLVMGAALQGESLCQAVVGDKNGVMISLKAIRNALKENDCRM